MKKGFTLIEMLMVLVLMGLVMGIGIPKVMQIIQNKSNDLYNVQLKIVDKATDLYTLRYQGDFKEHSDASCFMLDYSNLLAEKLLKEEDVKCSGRIILTPKGRNSYKRDYYLRCVDSSNNKEVSNYNESDVPSNCTDLSNLIEIVDSNVIPPIITGGNKSWVSTNIDITIADSGTPTEDIARYEYYLSDKPTTPTRNVAIPSTQTLTPSATAKATISADGTTYVWFRVVNKNNEVSKWSNREEANIDKATPQNPSIVASDSKGSGTTHTGDFALTFSLATPNVSGNTFYYGTSQSDLTNIASSINIDTTFNNQTIYVKACSSANKCSGISSYIVKF